MNIKRFLVGAALAGAFLGLASVADAGVVLIQGNVFFGSGTATTPYTKAQSQVIFSFDVTDPLNANPTTDITNFMYTLNGVAVNVVPTSVEFFSAANNGMFDLTLPGDVISIYGADIGSTGTVGAPGFYTVTAALNDGMPSTGNGGITVGSVTGVPEPATWAMMLLGVGLVGAGLRVMRRKDEVELTAA